MDKRVIFIAFPIDKCTTSKEAEKRFTELSEKVIDTYGSKGPVEIIDYTYHFPTYPSLVSAKRYLGIMKLGRYIYGCTVHGRQISNKRNNTRWMVLRRRRKENR